jgi:hypothetical protein
MDIKTIIDVGGSMGAHGILVILVYLLWKRGARLEAMLLECLQAGGKVVEPKVDDF